MNTLSHCRTLVAHLLLAFAVASWAAESDPPAYTYVQTEIATFIQKQASIRNELREGVSRLQNVCKKKPKTIPSPLIGQERDLSARLAENRRKSFDAGKLAEAAVRNYSEEIKRRKGEQCNSLRDFFREKNEKLSPVATICTALGLEMKAAESLAARLTEYKEISRARYDLFQELLLAESRGCARQGFTEQLLLVYEANNLNVELGIEDSFLGFIGKTRDALRTVPLEAK